MMEPDTPITPEPDEELIKAIAPDVMNCLRDREFFEKLDDVLSPADSSQLPQACHHDYRISLSILGPLDFDEEALKDIFEVLRSQGGFCDCEILYNVCETSRLKGKYWRKRAASIENQNN